MYNKLPKALFSVNMRKFEEAQKLGFQRFTLSYGYCLFSPLFTGLFVLINYHLTSVIPSIYLIGLFLVLGGVVWSTLVWTALTFLQKQQ